jgi:DMSO reductase family type II enzyme heme b subunit
MKVARIAGTLADPSAPEWSSVQAASVSLAPVALQAQPTEYIRQAWQDRPYGRTAGATVAAASDGERLYLRVEWPGGEGTGKEFHDAVGAVFAGSAPDGLETLGTAANPLPMWFWEDGRPAPLALVSRGPGVVRRAGDGVSAKAARGGGGWSVVLSGPASAAAGGRVGIAVWDGTNDERAGLAAVSTQWLPLELD